MFIGSNPKADSMSAVDAQNVFLKSQETIYVVLHPSVCNTCFKTHHTNSEEKQSIHNLSKAEPTLLFLKHWGNTKTELNLSLYGLCFPLLCSKSSLHEKAATFKKNYTFNYYMCFVLQMRICLCYPSLQTSFWVLVTWLLI